MGENGLQERRLSETLDKTYNKKLFVCITSYLPQATIRHVKEPSDIHYLKPHFLVFFNIAMVQDYPYATIFKKKKIMLQSHRHWSCFQFDILYLSVIWTRCILL